MIRPSKEYNSNPFRIEFNKIIDNAHNSKCENNRTFSKILDYRVSQLENNAYITEVLKSRKFPNQEVQAAYNYLVENDPKIEYFHLSQESIVKIINVIKKAKQQIKAEKLNYPEFSLKNNISKVVANLADTQQNTYDNNKINSLGL